MMSARKLRVSLFAIHCFVFIAGRSGFFTNCAELENGHGKRSLQTELSQQRNHEHVSVKRQPGSGLLKVLVEFHLSQSRALNDDNEPLLTSGKSQHGIFKRQASEEMSSLVTEAPTSQTNQTQVEENLDNAEVAISHTGVSARKGNESQVNDTFQSNSNKSQPISNNRETPSRSTSPHLTNISVEDTTQDPMNAEKMLMLATTNLTVPRLNEMNQSLPWQDGTFIDLRTPLLSVDTRENKTATQSVKQTPCSYWNHSRAGQKVNKTSDNCTAGSDTLSSFLTNVEVVSNDIVYGGIVSNDQYYTIMAYFRLLIPFPLGISVICAGISAIIFKDQRLANNAKSLVIAFNIAEGAKCLSFTINRVYKLILGESRVDWTSDYIQFFEYFIMWIPDSFGRIGCLLNGVITIDRFITLAFPLKRMNKKLIKYPKTMIAVIVVSMLLYQSSALILFKTQIENELDKSQNFTTDDIVSVIRSTTPKPFRIYWNLMIIGACLFRYIPLIMAIFFNSLTIISLVRHERSKNKTIANDAIPSKSQARRKQMNIMIVGSSLIFALLVSLKPLVRMVSLFHPKFGYAKQEVYLYLVLKEIVIFIDNLSPLINLLSYCRLSSVFRGYFIRLFLPASWVASSQDETLGNLRESQKKSVRSEG